MIAIGLLLSGWIIFQITQPGEVVDPGDHEFRTWFWENRTFDLAVQIALIFAGALGIAAILPLEDQDE